MYKGTLVAKRERKSEREREGEGAKERESVCSSDDGCHFERQSREKTFIKKVGGEQPDDSW
jgi:hypothetical protein